MLHRTIVVVSGSCATYVSEFSCLSKHIFYFALLSCIFLFSLCVLTYSTPSVSSILLRLHPLLFYCFLLWCRCVVVLFYVLVKYCLIMYARDLVRDYYCAVFLVTVN